MTNILKMVKCNSNETHNVYPNLNDQQQFRLNKIVYSGELMRKRLGKHIASFEYFDKSLIVLSLTICSASVASFSTIIGASVEIVRASFSLVFSVFRGIVKKLLKTKTNENKKHNKIVMVTRGKLNKIESKISEAFISSKISRQDFMPIINEAKKYRELKERIRMMNSQTSDIEKNNLIEEGKKIGIDEVIKHSKISNVILLFKV